MFERGIGIYLDSNSSFLFSFKDVQTNKGQQSI